MGLPCVRHLVQDERDCAVCSLSGPGYGCSQGGASSEAEISMNPTTNVHTEGCVKNKFWANSRDGMGRDCPVLMPDPQQSPHVRGALLRAQQADECLRDVLYFILFLMRSNLASCASNYFLERGISPSSPSSGCQGSSSPFYE